MRIMSKLWLAVLLALPCAATPVTISSTGIDCGSYGLCAWTALNGNGALAIYSSPTADISAHSYSAIMIPLVTAPGSPFIVPSLPGSPPFAYSWHLIAADVYAMYLANLYNGPQDQEDVGNAIRCYTMQCDTGTLNARASWFYTQISASDDNVPNAAIYNLVAAVDLDGITPNYEKAPLYLMDTTFIGPFDPPGDGDTGPHSSTPEPAGIGFLILGGTVLAAVCRNANSSQQLRR